MERILLDHGSGGKLMHELVDSVFVKRFNNKILSQKKDSAILRIDGKHITFTTDSYVVNPIFFAGGDIGSLAVYGTINDLSVCGARPLFISVSIIIEEGLDKQILEKVAVSIKKAAARSSVEIVTGDTKVVEKGACDKIFINTSGIGEIYYNKLSLSKIKIGDAVIVSGPIGDHAISVLSRREGMDFRARIKSDSAPLNKLIYKILKASGEVRFMRDPTRGGLATTLNEIVNSQPFGITIYEKDIPVTEGVRQACEILGFDPLYLACEGRVVLVAAKEDAKKITSVMRRNKLGKRACIIGSVTKDYKGRVSLATLAGGKRLVGMLLGQQLPRIC